MQAKLGIADHRSSRSRLGRGGSGTRSSGCVGALATRRKPVDSDAKEQRAPQGRRSIATGASPWIRAQTSSHRPGGAGEGLDGQLLRPCRGGLGIWVPCPRVPLRSTRGKNHRPLTGSSTPFWRGCERGGGTGRRRAAPLRPPHPALSTDAEDGVGVGSMIRPTNGARRVRGQCRASCNWRNPPARL